MVPHRIKPQIDLCNQTVELSVDKRERVSKLVQNGLLKQYLYSDALTIFDAFRRGARLSGNGDCLGYRRQSLDGKQSGPYAWIKYNEALRRAEYLAKGMIGKGVEPGQKNLVGIYSANRPEWILAEQACYFYSMVNVPLYDTLGLDACSFIIQQTEMQIIFIDKSKKAETLLSRHGEFKHLRFWVIMDKIESTLREKAREKGVELLHIVELEAFGAKTTNITPPKPPVPQDLATICYTSGTTGTPKGVMLTHANIIADTSGLSIVKQTFPNSHDTLISYLPLAHMFERILEIMIYSIGARVGFFRGDVKLLPEDLAALRPTIMPTVPRLLNRIYDKVMSEVSTSKLKTCLFNKALASKTSDLHRGIIRNNSCWDKLVFRKIRNSTGGRVRLMITGSAPCSPEILTFIRAAMGCVVLEGYGQTECVAAASVTMEGDHNAGHVGPPVPCCKVKLVDVPEMNYFARNSCGEVCVAGPHVFKGYFKDPERTAEALDSDGWLHTGDIGKWTPEGALKLIDRKKHIFKLAQGEYIAPEKIENVYNRSKYAAQTYVYGESLKSYLVAIVVPDSETLIPAIEKTMHVKGTFSDLCLRQDVIKLVMDDMHAEAEKAGLAHFEEAKVIYLHPDPFSVENGLLTPTFKTKRPALKEYFAQQLINLYKIPIHGR